MPHRAVIRDNAESTKLRVVYDASARAYDGAPSLNECLHTGPSLQNELWNVIVRNRFHPIAVAGDMRKAFLQIRVKEAERDALRFHWIKDKSTEKLEVLRFTRVVFGLVPSPLLLNAVIQQHLESVQSEYPGNVQEIKNSLYVDDLITGDTTMEGAQQLKHHAVEIFNCARFTLHKWHSNVPELVGDCTDDEPSFAKQQLGASSAREECKLLGLKWDKGDNTLHVSLPSPPATLTKRGILANLAKIYDPLGLVSPAMLEGKQIYRETSEMKLSWDTPLPEGIAKRWLKWDKNAPDDVYFPRSLVQYQEPVDNIKLHAFGDASIHGVCAAVYAVVTQVCFRAQSRL
ncbi:uncharacterized protein LOC111319209 [Stylophora pistillata]|uniref:uncharacterized protein LOC111319209 n=1 Tax=Stylophora pistillata TaxID=50429 RepID=UPI000C04B268|nr:uncharacterized protein LOC111319209 [Stylophora pistillata]